jgi:hypothetical protein
MSDGLVWARFAADPIAAQPGALVNSAALAQRHEA